MCVLVCVCVCAHAHVYECDEDSSELYSSGFKIIGVLFCLFYFTGNNEKFVGIYLFMHENGNYELKKNLFIHNSRPEKDKNTYYLKFS